MTLTPAELTALRLLSATTDPFRPYRGGPVAARTLAGLVPHGLVRGQVIPVHERHRRAVTGYTITAAGRAAI